MADAAVVLNISEMIDLAIGTPEVGVVDFNMLQTVLHCLAQQQRVLAKNVEVRGSIVSMPINRDNAHTIAITEYAIDTDHEGQNVKKDVAPPPPAPPPTDDTILVVERIKKDGQKDNISRGGSDTTTGGTRGGRSPSKDQGRRERQSRDMAPGEKLSLVTMSKFNVLENVVVDLKNRVYGSMPKNEDLLEEVRSQTNMKSITDMWTNLNVSSRLEAAEAGIAKLSSLIQDIINDTQKVAAAAGVTSALRIDAATTTGAGLPGFGSAPGYGADVSGTEAEFTASGTLIPGTGTAGTGAGGPGEGGPGAGGPGAGVPGAGGPGAGVPGAGVPGVGVPGAAGYGAAGHGAAGYGTAGHGAAGHGAAGPGATLAALAASGKLASRADIATLHKQLMKTREHLAHLKDSMYKALKEIQPSIDLPDYPVTPMTSLATVETASYYSDQGQLQGEGITFEGGGAISKDLERRLCELEKRFKTCCDKIVDHETNSEQLSSLQDQVEYLSKQVAAMGSSGAPGSLSPNLVQDLQGLMQLFHTVQEMQEQLKNVHETALQLAAEKQDRQSHINSLLEQIEMLKTVKLDREDMAEAMADKADLRMLARKVSHDQFEMACDDLSRGLEHALGKLGMQEALWQQALDDIQREIETKLDKMELAPVRDFFNSKLKQLQENLKQMANLRKEAEAAGTKRKLMRDVNCISCDANAVMSMEAPPSLPVPKPMPATLSMKPYLSYELDTIRKTQASQLQQRNMHDWENIDKQMAQPRHPHKVRSGADKHLCNRYCGGSHTTTTPAQRVARLGHFIKQWGPDVLPLTSGYGAGDDGRMYKVTAGGTQGATVGPGGSMEVPCTPKQPPEKAKRPELPSEKPQPPPSPECRCLESPGRANK